MSVNIEENNNSFYQKVFDEGGVSTIQIVVIAIALLLNMLDGFDVAAMAYTAHSIGEDLVLTPERIGLVFSAALAGMMLGAMFIAPYSDRVGRRKMILICVFTIGLSMCLTAFTQSLWPLIALRFITGLGVGGMLASLAAICTEYSPTKYRSLAVMTITAGYPIGATVGGFMAAPMIPAYGWESVFLAGGLATLAMGVLAFLYMPESLQFTLSKGGPDSLSRANILLQRLGASKLESLPVQEKSDTEKGVSVFRLLDSERRKQTILLWSSFLFCFINLYFMMSWVPKLVVTAGMSESTGVYAGVAFNGGAVVGILILGLLSAHIGLSKLISSFLSSAAILMVVFVYADGVNHLYPSLFVIGFLLQGGFVGLYAVAAKIYPTELRSTGVGWAIGLGRIGAVIGPYVGGVLITAGVSMQANFMIFSLPLLISGVFAYILAVK